MDNRKIVIVQQGDEARWRMRSNRPDFDPSADDFSLEIYYGMKGRKVTLAKTDFSAVGDGWFTFRFDTSKMVGYIVFRMIMTVTDSLATSGTRQEVDEQEICFVSATPCTHLHAHIGCAPNEPDVEYEFTPYDGETATYVVLRDVNGLFLRDADRLLLRALRTAAE